MKNVTPAHDATTAFLREVDEAMHQERLLAIWHRSKWLLLGAVIALLLFVAGKEAWNAWSVHRERTLASQWYAFETTTHDAGRKEALAKLLEESDGGTRAMALYAKAGMEHDAAAKASAYGELVKDAKNPQWLRDIARLNAALALMQVDAAKAKSELEVLTQEADESGFGPAYAPALELLALLAQQGGDVASAKGYTQKLLRLPGLPSDIRMRALQRLGALGGVNG